jgi:hypothetical protein
VSTLRVHARLSQTPVKVLALITGLSALASVVGLTGCVGARYQQSAGPRIGDNSTASSAYDGSQNQRIEDRRTAERVREALAAGADYRYGGVKVIACDGVVQLNGFVNTRAQRTSAREVASKVVGVKSVEDNLTVKD